MKKQTSQKSPIRKKPVSGGKRGGKRAGAGRKESEITKAKNDLLNTNKAEYEFALALFVETMHSKASRKVRLACAREVMDRIGGKPKQAIEHSGELPLLIVDR